MVKDAVLENKEKEIKSDRESKSEHNTSKTPGRSIKKLSDFDLEAHEEEINNRINKLKNSKDSNKKIVVVQFCIVSTFLIMIYTGSLLWAYISAENNKKFIKLAYALGSISVQIKMAFLIFSENLARQQTIMVPGTSNSLYAQAHIRGYTLGNDLTTNIQDFPAGFSAYQDYLKALLLQSVCKNYLEPKKNIGTIQLDLDCKDDSVLMSGLELINIKVLEYAQQNLARIATVDNPWTGNARTNTLALYNGDYLTSGKLS